MLVIPIVTKELICILLVVVSIVMIHIMRPPPLPLYKILYWFWVETEKKATETTGWEERAMKCLYYPVNM